MKIPMPIRNSLRLSHSDAMKRPGPCGAAPETGQRSMPWVAANGQQTAGVVPRPDNDTAQRAVCTRAGQARSALAMARVPPGGGHGLAFLDDPNPTPQGSRTMGLSRTPVQLSSLKIEPAMLPSR